DEMRATANAVGELDVLLSLATAATLYGYSRPMINDGNRISIKDGRHPVVERMMPGQYVPNDALLDDDKRRFIILTGPNMAGKSTFMRQTALIVLMAQMGSFVPAKSAEIGVVDRIFTRVGAFDDLVSGQSTFMVEMIEVANILNSATKKSLVLLDEMGRGTSTYDGLSIAWAVAEHISDKRKLGAKTIFATHYHQLTSLSDLVEGIVNQTMAVQEIGKEIVFLRKVIDGKSDRSYGIHVARLAGLPEDVLTRSEEVLAKIEEESVLEVKRSSHSVQMTLFGGVAEERIRRKLIDLDTSRLTPEEASKKLAELKRIAKGAGDGQD
ncbi:MAG: DNA mismatch repair protein MutS, partial [Thermoplasmata archaeon]